MILLTLAFISFLSPWLLLGLFILPAIWWLLKVTPPTPKHISFPPTWILEGLTSSKKSPAHTPLWLLLLRMAIAACIILALAAPLLFSNQQALPGKNTLVLIIDNGWASGENWAIRKNKALSLIEQARQNNRAVLVLPTAQKIKGLQQKALQAVSANDALRYATSLIPHPAAPNHNSVLSRLKPFLARQNKAGIIWLSDGLNYTPVGKPSFTKQLLELAPQSALQIITPEATKHPLGLFAKNIDTGKLQATILSTGLTGHTGSIQALNNKGQVLAEQPFTIAKGTTQLNKSFNLPLELRNQISRLEIKQANHPAAVYLLDASSQWQRIGVLSGESTDISQPLLSPLYYIEKAIKSYSEIHRSSNDSDANQVIEILKTNLSALILADIGQLDELASQKLEAWVKQGGTLIRFAGARMEEGSDDLLPVPLRSGGRTLGGALSWSTPQKLAKFEKDSPFFGLPTPTDIVINRQVLADPALLRDNIQIWARLLDGTPLVTARQDEKGWIVLFHITANTDWSNLSHSELFVNMLKRSIMISGSESDLMVGEADNSAAYSATALKPLKVLDGFGKLSPPPTTAEPLNSENTSIKADFNHPPGFYGRPSTIRSLNLMTDGATITALKDLPSANLAGHYKANSALSMVPFFFTLAFLLLLADTIFTYLMMNGREIDFSKMTGQLSKMSEKIMTKTSTKPNSSKPNSFFLIFGLALLWLISPLTSDHKAYAEKTATSRPKSSPQSEAFARKALTATRFAYVITGNSHIDNISRQGLAGLSYVTKSRTALEPADPIGVNLDQDDLSFFPFLYWPVLPNAAVPSAKALARIDHYMKHGGMIVFDQQTQVDSGLGGMDSPSAKALRRILGRLDIPALEPVPSNHVLTRSFYLLQDFPGRWNGGKLWTEAGGAGRKTASHKARTADGVSSILITSNDLASAWALGPDKRPLYPVVPGGEQQREMAFRTGVNIAMYALTGNYKADQVHTPALLERIGQ